MCWGDNSFGQLGIGDISNAEASPTEVDIGQGKLIIQAVL